MKVYKKISTKKYYKKEMCKKNNYNSSLNFIGGVLAMNVYY